MTKFKDFWLKVKTTSSKILPLPILLMILVVVLFTVVIIWSEPIANMLVAPTVSLYTRSTITPTNQGVPTGLPADVLETPVQTNGILFGAFVLVLIIVISTIIRIIPKRKKVE